MSAEKSSGRKFQRESLLSRWERDDVRVEVIEPNSPGEFGRVRIADLHGAVSFDWYMIEDVIDALRIADAAIGRHGPCTHNFSEQDDE